MKAIFLSEILRDCVARVSNTLTPQLKTIDPNITGVHYSQGHPIEIQKAMAELSEGISTKAMRYPAVWLFRDFPENKGKLPGIYSEAKIRLFIVTRTDSSYNSDKRETASFKPVLYPILLELLTELENTGYFETKGQDLQDFTQIDHYFWGKDGLFTKESNFFTDWLDCIELNNFNLSILTSTATNC